MSIWRESENTKQAKTSCNANQAKCTCDVSAIVNCHYQHPLQPQHTQRRHSLSLRSKFSDMYPASVFQKSRISAHYLLLYSTPKSIIRYFGEIISGSVKTRPMHWKPNNSVNRAYILRSEYPLVGPIAMLVCCIWLQLIAEVGFWVSV